MGCVAGLSWRIGATSLIGMLPVLPWRLESPQNIMRPSRNMNGFVPHDLIGGAGSIASGACAAFGNMQETGRGGPNGKTAMAEAGLSATETALENQRIGGLQIRVAALCTLIQI